MEGFGARLRQCRLNAHLSQPELADRVGLKTNTIGVYEIDKRTPSLEIVVALANALGVSTDLLLGLDAPPAASAEQLLRLAGYTVDYIGNGDVRVITPKQTPRILPNGGVSFLFAKTQFTATFSMLELSRHVVDLLKLAAPLYEKMSARRFLADFGNQHHWHIEINGEVVSEHSSVDTADDDSDAE